MLRDTAYKHDVGHRLDDTEAVDQAGNPNRQAFPRELVDQRLQPSLAVVMRTGKCKLG